MVNYSTSGTVTAVSATDGSIVVTGSPTVTPSIATGTLDVIAAQHPPAAAVAMNAKKITGLANGSAATDAAAYGQTLAGGALGPLTTEGDLIIANATPAPARLAVGAANQVLGVSGGMPAWQNGVSPLATTGLTGYALVNGTGNAISWTAPNDGAMHRVFAVVYLVVTSGETGGAIQLTFTDPSNSSRAFGILNGGSGTGQYGWGNNGGAWWSVPVYPNTTVAVKQSTALTGGAATLWAELWGS
jgi:hypothetical protein